MAIRWLHPSLCATDRLQAVNRKDDQVWPERARGQTNDPPGAEETRGSVVYLGDGLTRR